MMKLFIALFLCYAVLVVALFFFQRKLLYFPDRNIMPPESYGLEGFADLRATSADGTRVQLWYKAAQSGFPTIIYFHGNAAHLGNRAGTYHSFTQAGFGLLALSYRGYGKSEGTPSENGIYQDARAAIAYARHELNIPANKLIYYGESLGSGVAIQVANEQPPGAVVLEAPYTSVAQRAAEIYFYVPVQLLIRDRFESYRKIGGVHAPLLILHGLQDTVIPIAHGKAILAQANEPKQAYFFPNIGHNDFDRNVISAHVLGFAKDHHLVAPQ